MHLDFAIVVHEGKRRLRFNAKFGPHCRLQIRHPNDGYLIGVGLFDRCDRRAFGATDRSPLSEEPDDNIAALDRALPQEPKIHSRSSDIAVDAWAVDMGAELHPLWVTRAADGEQRTDQPEHKHPDHRGHRHTLAAHLCARTATL